MALPYCNRSIVFERICILLYNVARSWRNISQPQCWVSVMSHLVTVNEVTKSDHSHKNIIYGHNLLLRQLPYTIRNIPGYTTMNKRPGPWSNSQKWIIRNFYFWNLLAITKELMTIILQSRIWMESICYISDRIKSSSIFFSSKVCKKSKIVRYEGTHSHDEELTLDGITFFLLVQRPGRM